MKMKMVMLAGVHNKRLKQTLVEPLLGNFMVFGEEVWQRGTFGFPTRGCAGVLLPCLSLLLGGSRTAWWPRAGGVCRSPTEIRNLLLSAAVEPGTQCGVVGWQQQAPSSVTRVCGGARLVPYPQTRGCWS